MLIVNVNEGYVHFVDNDIDLGLYPTESIYVKQNKNADGIVFLTLESQLRIAEGFFGQTKLNNTVLTKANYVSLISAAFTMDVGDINIEGDITGGGGISPEDMSKLLEALIAIAEGIGLDGLTDDRFSAFMQALTNLGSISDEEFADLLKALKKVSDGINTQVENLITSLGDISDTRATEHADFKTDFGSLLTKLTTSETNTGTRHTALTTLLSTLNTATVNKLGDLATAITQAGLTDARLTTLTEAIAAAGLTSAKLSTLTASITALQNELKTSLAAISTTLTTQFTSLESGLASSFTDLTTEVTSITTIITALNTLLTSKLDAIKTSIDSIKTSIDTVKTSTDSIKTAIDEAKAASTTASTAIKTAIDDAKAASTTASTAIKTAIEGATSSLDDVKESTDSIKTAIDEAKTASTTASTAVKTSIDSVKTSTDTIKTAIEADTTAVTAAFESLIAAIEASGLTDDRLTTLLEGIETSGLTSTKLTAITNAISAVSTSVSEIPTAIAEIPTSISASSDAHGEKLDALTEAISNLEMSGLSQAQYEGLVTAISNIVIDIETGGGDTPTIPEKTATSRVIYWSQLMFTKPNITGTTEEFLDDLIKCIDDQEIVPHKILVLDGGQLSDLPPQDTEYLPINVHIYSSNKIILYAYTAHERRVEYNYYKIDDLYSGWSMKLTDRNFKSEQIVHTIHKGDFVEHSATKTWKYKYINPIITQTDNIIMWGFDYVDIEESVWAGINHTVEIHDGYLIVTSKKKPKANIKVVININGVLL
jgi:predicted  nucleic acid-binding Zn-ribbon protein